VVNATRVTDVPAPHGADGAGGVKVRAREPEYLDVLEFLNDEAAALDDDRLEDWLGMLAEDMRYFAPVRVTKRRGEGSGVSESMGHFDDTLAMLALRVHRVRTSKSAWAEDPPARTRRFVTNVRVFRTANEHEFRVTSNLLLAHSRFDVADLGLIAARRTDLLRRRGDDWRIADRVILIDQSTLSSYLSIFL
jgi:3-phenylpropionate/cinnamic acid dioxygenase small subunit